MSIGVGGSVCNNFFAHRSCCEQFIHTSGGSRDSTLQYVDITVRDVDCVCARSPLSLAVLGVPTCQYGLGGVCATIFWPSWTAVNSLFTPPEGLVRVVVTVPRIRFTCMPHGGGWGGAFFLSWDL